MVIVIILGFFVCKDNATLPLEDVKDDFEDKHNGKLLNEESKQFPPSQISREETKDDYHKNITDNKTEKPPSELTKYEHEGDELLSPINDDIGRDSEILG